MSTPPELSCGNSDLRGRRLGATVCASMGEDIDRSRRSARQLRRGAKRPPSRAGMSLGRLYGIEIRFDVSVLIVFALVVYSLGGALFPRWHPNWGATLTWGTAFAAGVLFFASLMAHELSHSVVAKLRGIPVPRITLFVFGGVSELEREPDHGWGTVPAQRAALHAGRGAAGDRRGAGLEPGRPGRHHRGFA